MWASRRGDVVAIYAYLGTDNSFAEALEEFAQVYADLPGCRPAVRSVLPSADRGSTGHVIAA